MADERWGAWLITAERVFNTSIFAYGLIAGICGLVRRTVRVLAGCFIALFRGLAMEEIPG